MVVAKELEAGPNTGLEDVLLKLYPEEGAHGKDHALQTARLISEIAQEPEYIGMLDGRDSFLVSVAALAHDVGYQLRRPYWLSTQPEHPYESVEALDRITDQIDNITLVEKAIVGLLILNHDNTNYRFPAHRRLELVRDGFTDPVGIPPGPAPGILFEAFNYGDYFEEIPADKFYAMLHILQEADSRLGDAQRTLAFAKSRNIPILADDGGVPGIGMPMWQYSGLASVLLATNRALLDAYTRSGQQKAWQMFLETRQLIKELVQADPRSSPDYDNVGELLRYEDIDQHIWSSSQDDRSRPHTHITQAFPLAGVRAILPDGEKINRIASRLVDTSKISGPPETLNNDQLEELNFLRVSIIKNYAFDIMTEVSGALRIFSEHKGYLRKYTLIPPVLKSSGVTIYDNHRRPFIVKSGYTWIQLAKELKIPEIRVLFVV